MDLDEGGNKYSQKKKIVFSGDPMKLHYKRTKLEINIPWAGPPQKNGASKTKPSNKDKRAARVLSVYKEIF